MQSRRFDQAQDLDIMAGGHRLRARWFVPRLSPDQPVVLLLHQGLGSVTQWRGFPEVLGRMSNCAVAGYDRFGHGKSDMLHGQRSADFLEREARDVLPDVLRALDIERPILYGHSDGGTIALMFAATYPDRPLCVISEAAHVFSEVHATGGMDELREAYQSGDLREKLRRHHGDNTDSMFHGWLDFWCAPERKNWSMTDQLPRIRCPLLLIQGEADEHGTMAQIETIVSMVKSHAQTCLIPGCGHIPHLEATDLVANRVATFIAENNP